MSNEDEPSSPVPERTPEEILLLCSRTGDMVTANKLLNSWITGEVELNVNCKGEQKSNYSWTPLHLACYFGHDKIASILVENGADVNVVNDTGDTPLHKAAYTGREDLVLLLLSNKADVFTRNSEGQTPRDVTKNPEISKLLKAAEHADITKKNLALLHAAREGDIKVIEDLLKSDHPPNINCTDSLGNTALHCAAYRGKKEVAVLLLQNGIDSSIRNLRGQLAIDLALNVSMKQLLVVQPVKHFQKTASRFEGLLLRKSRFLGWKEVWTVLEKGVMSFFLSRADATTGTRRKGYKYLDDAQVDLDKSDQSAFIIVFSDNSRQRYKVPIVAHKQIDQQKWVNAITEHIEFSSYYLKQGLSDSDPEEENDVIPIGTLRDKLQVSQAHLQQFDNHIDCLKQSLSHISYENNISRENLSYTAMTISNLVENLLESARKVSSSLSHCLTVFAQQEEIRLLQVKQQQERCRVLQDALHALAQEHHELEKSFVSPFHSPPHSPHYQDTECDEFFDAFEGDYSPPQSARGSHSPGSENTLADETALFTSFSTTSSMTEAMKQEQSKWGRSYLPVPQFSRNDFSVWSILKQCIGKELSKITMPVVFNEPLSFLQRLSENMEYSYLLDKADCADDPVERMEYVAAFAIASISSNWERLGKPFNPLLGETYELVRDKEKFRIVTEQVSHHPPVTAFHAESPHFVFTGAIHPKLKLWARSVEIKPEGTVILNLLKHNETYTWTGVTCCVHNIIVGKLWMEQCGPMEIICHTNGLAAELTFKPAGWYGKDLNSVEGFIVDKKRTRLRFLFGNWSSFIKSCEVQYYDEYCRLKSQKPLDTRSSEKILLQSSSDEEELKRTRSLSVTFDNGDKTEYFKSIDELPSNILWETDPRPQFSSNYYNFTFFAMSLNELKEGMESILPATDCRFRPDIRKLELGDVDGAAAEKNRLEEKQREARRIRKRDKKTWQPVWFQPRPHPFAKEESWAFKGGYWDRDFSQSPDIF